MKKRFLSFGKVKIQKLNRVVLPKYLLDNLEMTVGDEVDLFLDLEKDEIIIKKKKEGKK